MITINAWGILTTAALWLVAIIAILLLNEFGKRGPSAKSWAGFGLFILASYGVYEILRLFVP